MFFDLRTCVKRNRLNNAVNNWHVTARTSTVELKFPFMLQLCQRTAAVFFAQLLKSMCDDCFCFYVEYSSFGEGVWWRLAESHHLPPECCTPQRQQGDHRERRHWNCRGETSVCHKDWWTDVGLFIDWHTWNLVLLYSSHVTLLCSYRSYLTRWLTTCSRSASKEHLRNWRLQSG